MGYDYVLIGGGLAMAVAAVLFLFRAPASPKGQLGQPVGPAQPSADEPTPDRSVTSSPRQVETAKRHTPPA